MFLWYSQGCFPESTHNTCDDLPYWMRPICLRLHKVMTQGATELYFSGYAWHNRYTYSAEKIRQYNELAWGGGVGKGLYDEDGDWQGLYSFAFLESHKRVEPAIGYAFLKVHHFTENTSVGIGYTFLVTMRPDINHGIPFPGVLPWASVTHKKLTLSATYIPGSRNIGNVLYLVSKWTI